MAKKAYSGPIFFGLTPEDDPGVVLPPSQGTSGEDSQFTWDPEIHSDDITMFWQSGHDEIDLAEMDTDHNLYISKAEFDAWFASIGGNW